MPAAAQSFENDLMEEARRKASNRDFTAAAELAQKAASAQENHDSGRTAGIDEFVAECQFKDAFESQTRNEFRQKILLAKNSYEKAAALYRIAGEYARSNRSGARALYSAFWLADKAGERKNTIQECIALSASTTQISQGNADTETDAKLDNDLVAYHTEALRLATEWDFLNQHFERALNAGRNAILRFRDLSEMEGLLEALGSTIWLLAVESYDVLPQVDLQALKDEAVRLAVEMAKVAKQIGTPYAICLSNEQSAHVAFGIEGNYAKAWDFYQKAVSAAGEMGDSLILGRLLAMLTQLAGWLGLGEEFAEKRRGAWEKGIEFASRAIEKLEIPFHTTLLTALHSSYADCYVKLATIAETEPRKKRDYLKKAVEISRRGTEYEAGTWAWSQVAHTLSKAMYFLARLESEPVEKSRLLREASPVREETVRINQLLLPNSWSLGVMHNYQALLKAELAQVEQSSKDKTQLLLAAAGEMERCLDQCRKWATSPGLLAAMAEYCEAHGDILFQLYKLTQQLELGEKAVTAYTEAETHLGGTKHPAKTAALDWKIARVQDARSDYEQASAGFGRAAENYKLAADSLPSARATFKDLSRYMESWSLVEKARLHHAEEEYALAAEDYAGAAQILQETIAWKHLSKLSQARSFLETGEDLSRQESFKKSTQSFLRAQEGFRDAKNDLERKLGKELEGPEREEVSYWLGIAESREGYSLGRLVLEEAKALDRKGDKKGSCKKYDSASEVFRGLALQAGNLQDNEELNVLSQFCQSLARMEQAESKSSPKLFVEAAESFVKIRDLAMGGKLRLLASANACICHALEFGTQFRLTKDTEPYSKIKTQLEAAAEYYQEGGFMKAASWTRATQRLFDSLLYLAEAEGEEDPKKKTEYYLIAEKHLEKAAKLYGEAGFHSKKNETLGHLRRAREDKDLLLVSLETLAQMPARTGESITPAALTGARALGLERFEGANVIGNLTVQEKEMQVESDFIFEAQMANVGKSPATLVRLENVVPEGFEVQREKNPYGWEGTSIDLRGKRLEHLKMHEMRVVLKPILKGNFELRPRVFFADDNGNFAWHQFSPVALKVGEQGLAGWSREPGRRGKGQEGLEAAAGTEQPVLVQAGGIVPRVQIPPEFQFQTERSREIFGFLVKEFVKDYMSRRLYLEKAGWRSMMDVIRALKLPRSALYAAGGGSGHALAELERRGLVERRIFPEERGRGGNIAKVRVAYENEVVKGLVERAVIENR